MGSELYLRELGDGRFSILLCDDRTETQMPAMTPAEALIAFSELDYTDYRKVVRWLRDEHPLFEERIDIPVSDFEDFVAEAILLTPDLHEIDPVSGFVVTDILHWTLQAKDDGTAMFLLDWNTCFSEDELKNYVPEFLADGTMDGKLAVFPVSKSTYALFLNGSQFERFSADTGVTYDALSTWEGFFDAAAKYYDWSGGKPFCAFDYLIRHIEFDVMSQSGDLEYAEDGWYDLADPVLQESWMKFARSLAQGHIVVADAYANTQVMTGETLGGIGSSAAITYYNDTVTYPDNTSEPTNLKVLPLPRTGDGEQYMPMTGVGLSSYATTEQKAEAATVFVRWLTEGERNLDFVVETGYMPVSNDAFDAIEGYEFPDEGYASLFAAIKTMRDGYTPVVRPAFGGYYDKVDALYEGLRQMQGELRERSDNGENADALAKEIWDFFCSVQ